jgi:hypothetical protein
MKSTDKDKARARKSWARRRARLIEAGQLKPRRGDVPEYQISNIADMDEDPWDKLRCAVFGKAVADCLHGKCRREEVNRTERAYMIPGGICDRLLSCKHESGINLECKSHTESMTR